METINDVLHFLDYLDSVADLENHEYSNFGRVKKFLKDNFQDVDLEQLTHMLGVVNDLHILFLNQDFNKYNPLIESIRERIFTLNEKKTIGERMVLYL